MHLHDKILQIAKILGAKCRKEKERLLWCSQLLSLSEGRPNPPRHAWKGVWTSLRSIFLTTSTLERPKTCPLLFFIFLRHVFGCSTGKEVYIVIDGEGGVMHPVSAVDQLHMDACSVARIQGLHFKATHLLLSLITSCGQKNKGSCFWQRWLSYYYH